MDLRVRFTRKVKEVRKAEWDLEDAILAAAQLKDERDCALDELKARDNNPIVRVHTVVESTTNLPIELQETSFCRTAQDDILQSLREKLETAHEELHVFRHAQVSSIFIAGPSSGFYVKPFDSNRTH